jgi:pimeloyl-ACP methyl ester carboxylesterase
VSSAGEDRLRVGFGEIEVLRRGRGRPILLIHGVNPVSPQAPFLDGLAGHGEIIAPSAPGFGNSPRPPDFDTMYDLVHLYREVLDGLSGEAALIGFSFGGWIAAEIAAAGSPKIDHRRSQRLEGAWRRIPFDEPPYRHRPRARHRGTGWRGVARERADAADVPRARFRNCPGAVRSGGQAGHEEARLRHDPAITHGDEHVIKFTEGCVHRTPAARRRFILPPLTMGSA